MLKDNMKLKSTFRILAEGVYVNNDTRVTGNNNNDLIIGPSGAGKTRGYVIPNILQGNESMIIADTKGNLVDDWGPALKEQGFVVLLIDFKSLKSTCRWNPLEYISFDTKRDCYSERDIAKVVDALVPEEDFKEPFWDHAAAQYLSLLIAYVMDFLPGEEHTLESVLTLFGIMDSKAFEFLMDDAIEKYPDSTAVRYYQQIKKNVKAEKTHSSIECILSEHLHGVSYDAALAMYSHSYAFRFSDLGQEKIALFVNISDTDRSMDSLVSLFYTQALQDLCDFADQKCKGQRLPVPVRFILDDFATNIKIPDFDKFISVIRSRDIYVSVILQSLTQLTALYGKERADTIVDNCDNILYLGGQSIDTAAYVATRANLPENTILNMPLDEAYLFTRGHKPKKVRKFDVMTHGRYIEGEEELQ